MDVDKFKLLDEYINHITSLTGELGLKNIIYTHKIQDELRFKAPNFNMHVMFEGGNKDERKFGFLEKGGVFYYAIHQEGEIFVAVICRKSRYYDDKKSYSVVTNSEEIVKAYNILFRGYKELTIDVLIEKLNELKELKR